MTISTTSPNVGIKDGANKAEVTSRRKLQVSDEDMQRLIHIGNEQLRQLKKIAAILSAMSGIVITDDETDINQF